MFVLGSSFLYFFIFLAVGYFRFYLYDYLFFGGALVFVLWFGQHVFVLCSPRRLFKKSAQVFVLYFSSMNELLIQRVRTQEMCTNMNQEDYKPLILCDHVGRVLNPLICGLSIKKRWEIFKGREGLKNGRLELRTTLHSKYENRISFENSDVFHRY